MSLKELIIKWVFQYLLGYPNYSIRDIEATFEVLEDPINFSPKSFWGSLKLEKGSVQTVSIRNKAWRPVPTNIRIHSVLVHYWYNGKVFTHAPADMSDDSWPPKDNGLKFNMPIKHVVLCDENDRILFDITSIFKKLSGPKGNSDFVKRIKKLCIVDVLGNQSSIFVAK